MNFAWSYRYLLCFLLEFSVTPFNLSLDFYFPVGSVWYSFWATALPFSFHVCSFYNSKLGQSKVCGTYPPFLETLDRNLLIVMREIQSVIAPWLLHQGLQYLYCSRLVSIICSQVLSLSLQVCCDSISSLKLELSVTYNYAYNLNINYSKIVKFIKNKLKWMLMQIVTKMQ